MGSITIEQIASYASITVIILACIEAVKKTFFKTNQDKIKTNTKGLYELKEENECRKREIKEVKENLKELQSTSQITLESLLALINHEIDGNGKDAMKLVRNKLQKQLIDK